MTQTSLALNLNGHDRTLPEPGDRVHWRGEAWWIDRVEDETSDARVVLVLSNAVDQRTGVAFLHEVVHFRRV